MDVDALAAELETAKRLRAELASAAPNSARSPSKVCLVMFAPAWFFRTLTLLRSAPARRVILTETTHPGRHPKTRLEGFSGACALVRVVVCFLPCLFARTLTKNVSGDECVYGVSPKPFQLLTINPSSLAGHGAECHRSPGPFGSSRRRLSCGPPILCFCCFFPSLLFPLSALLVTVVVMNMLALALSPPNPNGHLSCTQMPKRKGKRTRNCGIGQGYTRHVVLFQRSGITVNPNPNLPPMQSCTSLPQHDTRDPPILTP